jgi:hypothetical protein
MTATRYSCLFSTEKYIIGLLDYLQCAMPWLPKPSTVQLIRSTIGSKGAKLGCLPISSDAMVHPTHQKSSEAADHTNWLGSLRVFGPFLQTYLSLLGLGLH